MGKKWPIGAKKNTDKQIRKSSTTVESESNIYFYYWFLLSVVPMIKDCDYD